MGSSTVKLQDVIDFAVAQGVPDPVKQPGGYGNKLALKIANDCSTDLISQRFNFKWNAGVAAPFYTNIWQQDYPQLGNANIGWLEDADRIDINNTNVNKPLKNLTIRRELSRTSWVDVPTEICWMFNAQLSFGVWPGANTVYYPLVGAGAPAGQNPIMNMIDAAGNLLILTTFGTTGANAPAAAANAAEGTTVNDGSCVWTVVAPTSKGFRLNTKPGGANGPTWMVVPKFQNTPVRFTELKQYLDPIPDDFEAHFTELYKYGCRAASPNPADRGEAKQERFDYLQELENSIKQGNREQDAYALIPMESVVESVYPRLRRPSDPSEPY